MVKPSKTVLAKLSWTAAAQLEAKLRAFFQDDPLFLGIYRTVRASATEAGVVVHVEYSDGRSSDTTFVGDCDPSDVDDMMALLELELTQNGLEVFERIGEPFAPTFHQREPVAIMWEHAWIPKGPIPSLKLRE